MVDKKRLDSYNSTPEESKNKKHEADNEDNESTFSMKTDSRAHLRRQDVSF